MMQQNRMAVQSDETSSAAVADLSVVICARNASETIGRALRSVVANRPLEIIVIDGNSSDATKEIASRFTSQVFTDRGNGLADARQMGAELARGQYVAYVDADTELPTSATLTEVLTELLAHGWSAASAQLVDPQPKSYWEKGENFFFRVNYNPSGPRKSIGTIVSVVERKLILDYQFDSFFRGASEDGDFFYRVTRDGHTIGMTNALAYHYHRSSAAEFVRQRLWYGKGNARFFWKHRKLVVLLSPAVIVAQGLILTARHLRPQFIPFFLVWGACLATGMLLEGFWLLRESRTLPPRARHSS